MSVTTPISYADVARTGAAYMAGLVKPDGRFRYQFNHATGESEDEYEIVRHLGTLWSMLDVHRSIGAGDALVPAARRAGAYVLDSGLRFHRDIDAACIGQDNNIYLGGNALAILALLALATETGDDYVHTIAVRLGEFILANRRADGDFVHRIYFKSGRHSSYVDRFWTGEAWLALIALFEATGDQRWLDAVVERERENAKLDYAASKAPHWMLYAMEGLARHCNDDAYYRRAAAIAGSALSNLAAIRETGAGTGVACRSEGLLAFLRMTRHGGATAELRETCLTAVRANLRMQMSCRRFDGAFVRGGKKDKDHEMVRIDVVQHNVSSFLHFAVDGHDAREEPKAVKAAPPTVRTSEIGDGKSVEAAAKIRDGRACLDIVFAGDAGLTSSPPTGDVGRALSDADLVIANLEKPFAGVAANDRFPEHSIAAVSLANRHAHDLGLDGFERTERALDAAGIVGFDAPAPLVIDTPVGSQRFRMAVCGGGADQARALRAAGPDSLIVAFPDWGEPYAWRSAKQARDAEALLDAGVDLVLGHGARTLQEIEYRDGRWVVYGLGGIAELATPGHRRVNTPPFGLMALLRITEHGDGLAMRLRLRPVATADAPSRFVTDEEFWALRDRLAGRADRSHELLGRLSSGGDGDGPFLELDIGRAAGSTPVAETVRNDRLVCLEDGREFKQLTRHLAKAHGLTPDQYRRKWKLPSDAPMSAPAAEN